MVPVESKDHIETELQKLGAKLSLGPKYQVTCVDDCHLAKQGLEQEG